jgi:L-2,4-diaminobutyrate decarboxylase
VLLAEPQTGIVAWRPSDTATFESVSHHLPAGAASMTKIVGERWFRSVAANPNADIKLLISGLLKALYEVRLA